MNVYCTCGFKNEYSGVKPKFCGNCGQSFDKAFRPTPVPAPSRVAPATYYPPQSNRPIGQFSRPAQEPEFIDLSDLIPDASSVQLQGEETRRMTIADVQNNKSQSFGRSGRSNIIDDPDALKEQDEFIRQMVASAPPPQPVAPISTPAPRRKSTARTPRSRK